MSIDWHVNEYILKSGTQLFEINAFPYDGLGTIDQSATIAIKVFVRDALVENTPRELLLEVPIIEFKKKQLNKYTYSFHFYAEVPYKLTGWSDSIVLTNENIEKLTNELYEWYDRFYDIFINKDLETYTRINTERFNEISTAFYLTEEEKIQEKKSQLLSQNIKKIDITFYRPKFFGNGRVIGLHLPKEPCGFAFESTEVDNEEIDIELALFHKKSEEQNLTLIR
ncbi:hypothetical protein [Zobellia uliginosa]|uniref:hypothetical protein n=1 Tax=Zobellia uliginosa TaxID=143224 RepID=UPI0026E185C4|nr:hypothetical protein [Zobellia uliginosa]MDO6519038.1 hypothetical protein [Zobellia uliginosa]